MQDPLLSSTAPYQKARPEEICQLWQKRSQQSNGSHSAQRLG